MLWDSKDPTPHLIAGKVKSGAAEGIDLGLSHWGKVIAKKRWRGSPYGSLAAVPPSPHAASSPTQPWLAGEANNVISQKQPLSTELLRVGGREQAGVPQGRSRRSRPLTQGGASSRGAYKPQAEPSQLPLEDPTLSGQEGHSGLRAEIDSLYHF